MEVSPSRRFEKTLVFPTCKHSRTLPIDHPVNSSHPKSGKPTRIKHSRTLIHRQPMNFLFYRVFTQENSTSFLRKSSSPFSLHELRPLTPLKATDRFTSLTVIGMKKIMCNNQIMTGHKKWYRIMTEHGRWYRIITECVRWYQITTGNI
jgi:hypothetical protein